MAGIILRLPIGIKLPEDFIQNLRKLFGSAEIEIEYFSDKVDYSRSYTRRRDSFYNAFCFILKAYPPSSPLLLEPLKEFADLCKAEYVFNEQDSVPEMQQKLIYFSETLVHALKDCWTQNQTFKEAIECLNEAEQYVLMQQGRKDIATIIPLPLDSSSEPRLVLQWDKVLRPHNDLFLEELATIKALGSPVMPSWYYQLTNAEKTYLSLLPSGCDGAKTLQQDVIKLKSLWNSLHNTRKTVIKDECIAIENKGNLPEWYKKLDKKFQIWFAEEPYSKLGESIAKFELTCKKMENEPTLAQTLQLCSTLPLWYTVLPTMQQSFLKHVLKTSDSIEAAFSWLPSRLRTLPALPNAREHYLRILDNHGNLEILEKGRHCINDHAPRYAFSHIVPRDALLFPKEVLARHNNDNLNLLCNLAKPNQLIYIDTLISPLKAYKYVQDYLPKKIGDKMPPDYQLAEQLKKTIAEHPNKNNIYHANHPLNYTKHFAYTESNSPECLAIIELAKSNEHLDDDLKILRIIFEQALKSDWGTASARDYRGRELFLSSLGHLISMYVKALSTGSCVSGKDRRAVALIHENAMLLYYYNYGKWHQFTDPAEERANFVKFLVLVYVSRHHHEHAGQNAFGSDGIKTPDLYWPQDIVNGIIAHMKNPQTLKLDEILATNNELKHVGLSEKNIKAGAVICHLIAVTMPRDTCQKLIDSLAKVLEEKPLFAPKIWKTTHFVSSPEPQGITAIRKKVKGNDTVSLQKSQEIGKKNLNKVVEDIMFIVYERPKEDKTRSDTTTKVYNLIQALYTQAQSQEDIENTIKELDKLHTSSMEKNVCTYS